MSYDDNQISSPVVKRRRRTTTSSSSTSSTSQPLNTISTATIFSSPSGSTISRDTPLTRKKRSAAWRYFNQNENDSSQCICNLCKVEIKRYGNGTSALLEHLSLKHSNEYKVVRDGIDRSKPQARQHYLPIDSERSKYVTKLIMEYLLYELLPINMVESDAFKNLIYNIEPAYNMPSRTYFTYKVLLALYNETRTKVEDILRTANGISITTDCWTSIAHESYVTVTAQFLTQQFEMKIFILETIDFSGRHTADALAKKLQEIFEEWNITHKIVSVVTDNTASVRNAAKLLPYEDWGCFAHLLNLSVVKGINLIHDEIDFVRKIVIFTRRSTLGFEELKSEQDKLQRPHRSLIIDVITSMYYMLQRFIEEKQAILACLSKKEFSKKLQDVNTIASIRWSVIEELLSVLKPWEQATRTKQNVHDIKQLLILLSYTCEDHCSAYFL
ncbi:unnamed protein product [Didymodactylos carnosus]|uniref:BED-type domain-containing protein n=2 Tax=Didymodactylos carnosus TaxID=1234261 RepID=A0A815KV61_9BILA|nr:unnamed protein product [Didymodactylos carnosus]CAF4292776.1 unnamed protein product [Didymodactylos carnosus]